MFEKAPASQSAAQFDAARQQFLTAVDLWLADEAVDPEARADEVRVTVEVLRAKLRLVRWD